MAPACAKRQTDVPVHEHNRLEPPTFAPSPSRAGNYIELCADMDVLAVISNCPQVNSPCNSGRPTPIRVVVYEAQDEGWCRVSGSNGRPAAYKAAALPLS